MAILIRIGIVILELLCLPVHSCKAEAPDVKDGATRACVPTLLAAVFVQRVRVHQHKRGLMRVLHPVTGDQQGR